MSAELFGLARQVRPGFRVLYISGHTEKDMVYQGRLDPAMQLLSKPYSRATLSQKLRDALALSP